IAELRFADISCGSGSFLIAIFETVNQYLEHWYTNHPVEARAAGCREMQVDETGGLQYALSLEQKRAILQRNIYGVDIDAQAVELRTVIQNNYAIWRFRCNRGQSTLWRDAR